jgi:diguanylate cyclase
MTPSFPLAEFVLIGAVGLLVFSLGWSAHRYTVRRRLARGRRERRLARDVLASLRSVIENVSAEVDEHGEMLSEVNEGLALAVSDEPRVVAAALTKVLVANTKMRGRLAAAESRLGQQARVLAVRAAEARTDSLTQLANRRAFDSDLRRCFAAYRRQKRIFSVVLLDIDGLAHGNDCHGRSWGDRALARVGAILRDKSREMDLVARFGEDEFAMILPGTSLADATKAAERVCAAVAESVRCQEDEPLRLTLSAGVAEAGMEDSIATLLERTDAALRQSKTAGGNQAHYHDGAAVRSSGENLAPPADEGDANRRANRADESAATDHGRSPGSDGHRGQTPEAAPASAPPRPESESLYLCARGEFHMAVGRRLAEWRRGGPTFSLVLVRMANYERTVAECGVEVEPRLRSALWHAIASTTRDMDLVGLYDQETFAILVPQADRRTAERIAARLRGFIERRPLVTSRGPLRLAVRCGIAEPEDRVNDSADGLMARAIEAVVSSSDGSRGLPCDDNPTAENASELETVG